MIIFRTAKVAAFILGIGMSLPCVALPEHTFVLGYLSMPNSLMQDAIDDLPARVSKATGGRVEIKKNSSIVNQSRLLEGVRDGVIDMTIPLNGGYASTNPEYQLALLPGISDSSINNMMNVVQQPEYSTAVQQMLAEKYNSIELLYGAWCPQVLFSEREVTKLEDWKGLRVMAHSPGLARVINAVGGQPVTLSIAERIPALQRGVIGGVVGDSCGAYGQGIYDVVKHASIWPYSTTLPWHLVMNKDSWDSLPEDLQLAIKNDFVEYQKEIIEKWIKTAKELPAMYEAKGVTWHQVPKAEAARFGAKEHVQPLFDIWYDAMESRAAYRGDPRELEQAVRAVIAPQ